MPSSDAYDRMLANAPAALAQNDVNVAGTVEEGSDGMRNVEQQKPIAERVKERRNLIAEVENPYPEWRKSRCEHCRAGVPMFGTIRHRQLADQPTPLYPLCTAPTPEAYIAVLEAELAQWKSGTDSIHNLYRSCMEAREEATKLACERDEARAALRLAVGALRRCQTTLDELANAEEEDGHDFILPDSWRDACSLSSDTATEALSAPAVAAEAARLKAQGEVIEAALALQKSLEQSGMVMPKNRLGTALAALETK